MQPRHRQQMRYPRRAEGLLHAVIQTAFVRQQHSGLDAVQLPRQPAAQCGRPALPQPIQRKPRRAAGVQWVVAAQILCLQIDPLALAAQAVFVVGQLGQRKFCSEPLPRTLAGKGRALHLYVGRPAVNFSQPQRTAQAAFAVGNIGVRLHHHRAGHGLPCQCLDGPHPYKSKHQKPRKTAQHTQYRDGAVSAAFYP